MSLRRAAILAAFLLPVSVAFAQTTATPEDEYKKLIKVNEDLQPLGENPFGERIGLYDGSLSFEQVDVSVPGTGPTITIGREFALHTFDDRPDLQNRAFGDWDIDLPEIVTTTANQNNVRGWLVEGATNQKDVCTGFSAPPSVAAPTGDSARSDWEPESWWQGYQLRIPGEGSQDLLHRSAQNTASPSSNFYQVSYPDFPIVTTQNWAVGCVQHASTDPTTQSFMAISPDGTRYWLDHLAYRYMPSIERPLFSSPVGFAARTDAVLAPAASATDFLVRREGRMLVTRVQDRFGNFISYTYSGDQIVAIDGSDGRHVSIAYEAGTPRISTVTVAGNAAGSRTWTYGYTKIGLLTQLTSIRQPDGSTWSFDMSALNSAWVDMRESPGTCEAIGAPGNLGTTYTGRMVHPSGLSGAFTVTAVKRGRSNVPQSCLAGGLGEPNTPTFPGTYSEIPNAWYNMAIVQRQLSGTGIGTQAWSYVYSPSFESWSKNCAAGCQSSVWTKVTFPDGHAERSTFSNRYDYTESVLLGEEVFDGGADATPLRRTTTYSYVNPNPTFDGRATFYVHPWGFAPQGRVNRARIDELVPMATRLVFQDRDQFQWAALAYDSLGRPTEVQRNSSFGYLVTERTSYLNDFPHWVIGLPTTSENLTTGETISQNVYNAADQTLLERYHFGRKVMSYTFNPQGQLASFTDGNSHTTTLQDYYRGIPRTIHYPDSTGQSLAVDDLGQVTAIARQNGALTSYRYDAIGRLSDVIYPSGDSVAWNAMHIVYDFMPAADRNIGGAHWRATVTEGNRVDQLYYDAMLRPIIHDSHPVDNSIYYSMRMDYDWRGNPSFQSYWNFGAPFPVNMSNGIYSTRDVLNRPIRTRRTSELGDLITATTYLDHNRTVTTDPKGNVTTAAYLMFDRPAYDTVELIDSPGGIRQSMPHDTYGNPVSITQSGGGQSVMKTFTYDSQHRLCRTWEPESGSEILGYDNANNMAWSVSGASFNGAGCGQDQVIESSKVERAYDAMNRVTSVVYPSGTQPITLTYDALGNVATTTAGAVGWTFGRNRRGLLTSETLSIDGHNWTLGYGYDGNGVQSSTTYPDGEAVAYNPDALGRPTTVGNYVSGLSLFRDGTIQFYRMGSGATYVGTKNLRDTFGNFAFTQNGGTPMVSENITYDANGNVTQLTDIATGGQRTKSMSYDGLDRLTGATADSLWGTEAYGYDALNNIRSITNSSGTHTYNYDAFNLLASITSNGVTQHTFRYDVRGNTVAKDANVLNFDLANRLTSIDGKGAYTYDAAGRRAKKVSPSGTTYYAYDGTGKLMWEYDAGTSDGTNYIYLGSKLIASSKGPSL
jgi:YD repeat-containing protein